MSLENKIELLTKAIKDLTERMDSNQPPTKADKIIAEKLIEVSDQVITAKQVKELAKETAKSTEDISRKVEAIQNDTRNAVEAIKQVGEIIKQINEIQNTIIIIVLLFPRTAR